MSRKHKPNTVRAVSSAAGPRGTASWILHLIDKGLDSITAAGPVAWISVVAIVALCAVVCVVYIMSGAATKMP